MFNVNADPIGHDPVYKRFAPNEPKPGGLVVEIKTTAQICMEIHQRSEQARMWELLRQTAGGTNAPMPVLDVQD